ncbi:uncharacterized protein LOC141899346 [Tubulanus polymorphus]|uniref:uncharacterized protein LOC141899346 n=1 Tax=Tubulanus polymorphus TaxID=672921 RepID=UPI003DA26985
MVVYILLILIVYFSYFNVKAVSFDECEATGTWEFIDEFENKSFYVCKLSDSSVNQYECGSNGHRYTINKEKLFVNELNVSDSTLLSFVDLMKLLTYECAKCKVCFAENSKNVDARIKPTSLRRLQHINHVHLVYMNHLDVGYTTNHFYPGIHVTMPGYINNVLNWYFKVYFPRAIKLGQELRRTNSSETFIYTTHPWLVTMYLNCPRYLILSGVQLQCPNKEEISSFTDAVKRGVITWHAGPLNQEAENSDAYLFNNGLAISEELDERFGIKRNFRTLSQRDIPGMTQAVIPFLAAHNISAVSVGVNWASSPPAVPSPNRWRYGNSEVITYWHKGGYPGSPGKDPKHPGGLSRKDCQIVQNLDHALCFAFRADNYGPPDNIQEIKRYYRILKGQFPSANIRASTLEDFTAFLHKVKSELPVVTSEIGDTWIQGSISDPLKISVFRAIKRAQKKCFEIKKCSLSDSRIRNMTRYLTKLPEHTYGIASALDKIHWSNAEFYPRQFTQSSFQNCTKSWISHRRFNDLAVEALMDHPLVNDINNQIRELRPKIPNLDGFVKNPDLINDGIRCSNGLVLKINKHGSLVELFDANKNIHWASESTPLGQLIYNTYSEEDTRNLTKYYDYQEGGPGYYKLNVSRARPESKSWFPDVVDVYTNGNNSDICSNGIYILLQFTNVTASKKYGAPQNIWLKYQIPHHFEKTIDIELQYFDKNPTRLPEALFFNFYPVQLPGHHWLLEKLGHMIDPSNIVLNGSQYQHGIDQTVQFIDSNNHGMIITANDTNIVSIVTKEMAPTPYPAPLFPMSKPLAVAFNILNNVWETNFIFWYPFLPEDRHFKTRFSVVLN